MNNRRKLLEILARALGFACVGVALFGLLRPLTAGAKVCPDYICYYAAGSIVIEGGNPYDVALQTDRQVALGWDRATEGLGIYAFLPFYYPPWFAWICAGFASLGYANGKVAWLAFNLELLLVTAYLLRDAVRGLPRMVPLVATPFFVFSWATVVIGQTTPLIFFLLVTSWKLIEARRDRLAGLVLAWLSIKPQLTGVVLLAVSIWSIRQGRWGIIRALLAMLATLAALSFAIQPSWLACMLAAPRATRPPTEYFPWIGTTWYLFLKGLGLGGWRLWGPYLAVALPFLARVVRTSAARPAGYADVLSIALLAAYVVAPYGRHYDFPVLLIPALVLLGDRLGGRAGALLLVTLLAAPYLQYMILPWIKARMQVEGGFNPEVTFAWIPLLLTALWLGSGSPDPAGRPVVAMGCPRDGRQATA